MILRRQCVAPVGPGAHETAPKTREAERPGSAATVGTLACGLIAFLAAACSTPTATASPAAALAPPPVRNIADVPRPHQDARRLRALEAAFAAADAGTLALDQATAQFRGDPLLPWLQATIVRKQVRTADPRVVHPLLRAWGESAPARWLRPAWLSELARREDWNSYAAVDRASDDPALRCASLTAKAAVGDTGDWNAAATSVYLTGKSLPARCDGVLERMAARGVLDAGLRWQRIRLALVDGEPGVVRSVAAGLPADEAAQARAYADYLESPAPTPPAGWLASERGRLVVASGLARLARKDPDRAQDLLQALPAPGLDEAARGKVLYEIALWTVASYLPNAAQRLAAVPASAYDDKLREWQVREAIARGDDAGALAAIGRMSPKQREDSHWLYYEARLRERLGQGAQARALFAQAAAKPGFHGWLAADRLQVPYALCPLEPRTDAALRARVDRDPALARALDLFVLDRVEPATREWSDAVKGMDDDARRIAVQRAIGAGWFDRAVFGLGPGDTQHYSLRFPLHHAESIRRYAAAQSLDPAWVAAQTRSESSFMPKARSGADARGLMQLQPGTGLSTAKRLGVPWTGGDSLYDPDTNLQLGTAYLRQMLERYNGQAYLAIAAYNAGPAPVDRWRAARGQLEPDMFIESIPWKETREYVARVLAFSVVYDWRLNGRAAPLGDRMLGRLAGDGARRGFRCEGAP
jgi:soluble lytic murein transglycosylase